MPQIKKYDYNAEKQKEYRKRLREKLKEEQLVKRNLDFYLDDAERFETETLSKLKITGRWDSKVDYSMEMMRINYSHALKGEELEYGMSYISLNHLSTRYQYFCPSIVKKKLCDQINWIFEPKCIWCNHKAPKPEDMVMVHQ